MAALCCVPVPAEEPGRSARELEAANAAEPALCKPKLRTLKRRLHTLKAGAAPERSGWRSAHLLEIADRIKAGELSERELQDEEADDEEPDEHEHKPELSQATKEEAQADSECKSKEEKP